MYVFSLQELTQCIGTVPPHRDALYQLDRCDVIMQFTGLHDQHGKEIWEGDVVRSGDKDERLDEVVVFEGGAFQSVCLADPSIFEVLGNIYEQPELVKSET